MKLLVESKEARVFAEFDTAGKPRGSTFLRGRIVLSGKEGVFVGDSVGITGTAINFVFDSIDKGASIFQVEVIENGRKQGPNDPKLFAPKVALPEAIKDNTASIRAALDVISGQVEAARRLLP
jgi:hypothetical protein